MATEVAPNQESPAARVRELLAQAEQLKQQAIQELLQRRVQVLAQIDGELAELGFSHPKRTRAARKTTEGAAAGTGKRRGRPKGSGKKAQQQGSSEETAGEGVGNG